MMRILLLLIWLILGIVYWFIWDKQKTACCETVSQTETSGIPVQESPETQFLLPIQFKWNNAVPETTVLFENYKDSLINLVASGGLLEITGIYHERETADRDAGDDLGLLRAKEIKDRLFPELKPDQYKLLSSKNAKMAEDKNLPFSGSAIEFIRQDLSPVIEDRMLYFPFGSADFTLDTEVSVYLDGLVKWIAEKGGRAVVTGHTDNIGSQEINYQVGLERAEKVKTYLESKGIVSDMVTIRSEGMMKPIAPNETEEGRARNRRAEIKTIQN